MEIIPVKSSAVLKIGYDGNSLFVQYVGGKWYKYLHVPEEVYKQFNSASSKGTFANKHIKPNYPAVPLTSRELETVRRISLQQEKLCPTQ